MNAAPDVAVAALAACRDPLLIGVRHHSPALAAAMPGLLAEANPDVIAIELPAEASGWLGWLTHPDSIAPLALAFSSCDDLSFYPFADFSPELVALRWAREHQVPVRCVDLALSVRDANADAGSREEITATSTDSTVADHKEPDWSQAMQRAARAKPGDVDETWDRLVEAPAVGSTPEQIRVAALAHGWASRRSGDVDADTAAREASMREQIAAEVAAGRRVVAVVGAFHAPVLAGLTGVGARHVKGMSLQIGQCHPDAQPQFASSTVTGCLVGYTFAQLDSRSGYPAGIRDPGWQQEIVEAGGDARLINVAATRLVTNITRALRAAGHPAGPGEAAEVLRMATDLAALRRLAAPSRRELIEAVTAVLAHGEVLGRGRAVAKALEAVLIGKRAGRVAPGAPVSALRGTVLHQLQELGLPTTGEATIRVEPLRGARDLAKHVLLRRLGVAGIRYGYQDVRETWRGSQTIETKWEVEWTAATDASIELAAAAGLTPEQVANTRLLARRPVGMDQATTLLLDAADCGSAVASERALGLVAEQMISSGFTAAARAVGVLADVATARIPGADTLPQSIREGAEKLRNEFTGAAVRELPGIAGSDSLGDVNALAAFVALARDHELGVRHGLKAILVGGSPLMQGAAAGLLVEQTDDRQFYVDGSSQSVEVLISSWLRVSTPAQRTALRRRLAGLLAVTAAQLDTAGALRSLVDEVNRIDDAHFVSVLPALRGGCDAVSEGLRREMLDGLALRFGPAADLVLSPDESVAAARYDAAARDRLAALGIADVQFSPAERWRLILGQQRPSLSMAGRRLASALDELYGRPANDALDAGMRGANAGPSQVGVREWAHEIEALFGDVTLTEVFAQAAEGGRADVLTALDPDQVRPSVELLSTALSVTGALPEARLAKLRPLVSRLVADLTAELAVRIRPALVGLSTSRPTRRRTSRLDLDRTIRSNLRHVVVHQGRTQIVPVTPIFAQAASREADWHVIVLVDVSGSMSESVVFSALTAAVLAGVRCLQVTFLAFSTEVIDFSDHVSDPLALLLEVEIGGGTDIAGAFRVARSRVRVPSRTLCVVVSDFEEYGPVAPLFAEVAELHAAGVRLLGCAALDYSGTAVYNVGIAGGLAAAGMRVAVVSPQELAHWVGQVVRS